MESTCLGGNSWSQEPPVCSPSNPCTLPAVGNNISCLGDRSWTSCQKNEFCMGEEIGWSCPGEVSGSVQRTASCQCDGYWSEEVCPQTACDTLGLEYCGSNLDFTANVSYYDTVPLDTTATFNSNCGNGVTATMLCTENGQWFTEKANMCSLPKVDGFAIVCDSRSCKDLGNTQFCAGETISATCPLDGVQSIATCQCDGNWSKELCPPPACDAKHLQQCGSNLSFTPEPSYYGTVPPDTMAYFNPKCSNGATATSLCQESGEWQTSGVTWCALPEVDGLVLYCNKSDGVQDDCQSLGRTQFCAGEQISWKCKGENVVATCKCDGSWSSEMCQSKASIAPSPSLTDPYLSVEPTASVSMAQSTDIAMPGKCMVSGLLVALSFSPLPPSLPSSFPPLSLSLSCRCRSVCHGSIQCCGDRMSVLASLLVLQEVFFLHVQMSVCACVCMCVRMHVHVCAHACACV